MKLKYYKLINANGKIYLSNKPGAFGGHRKLKIFGKLNCPSALRFLKLGYYKKYRVFFIDFKTAIAAGYRPCARCLPIDYAFWKQQQK